MNYYDTYGQRELVFLNKYISENQWISSKVENVQRDNTSLHDLIIKLKSGREITVEVKEDELYWFSRTGNIGLDYISSFRFLNPIDKNQYRNLWVDPIKISTFEKQINVSKYGKLITCDADLQFYFVLNESKDDFVFARIYDNNKLKSHTFVNYLKTNYSLRINDKNRYKLEDTWESAAFFVNPLRDPLLKKCEINPNDALLR